MVHKLLSKSDAVGRGFVWSSITICMPFISAIILPELHVRPDGPGCAACSAAMIHVVLFGGLRERSSPRNWFPHGDDAKDIALRIGRVGMELDCIMVLNKAGCCEGMDMGGAELTRDCFERWGTPCKEIKYAKGWHTPSVS